MQIIDDELSIRLVLILTFQWISKLYNLNNHGVIKYMLECMQAITKKDFWPSNVTHH